MAAPSLTYTLTNNTPANATHVQQNFQDLLDAVTDGASDLSVNQISITTDPSNDTDVATKSYVDGLINAGKIPVGGIIAIAADLTGAYSIPSSGTVDTNGFMYCDGSAIPAGKTLEGNVYNLSDSRFLMGSSSAGSTGGTNTNASTSGGAASFNKTSLNTNQTSHSHTSGSLVAHVVVGNSGGNEVKTSRVNTSSWSSTQRVTGFGSSDTNNSDTVAASTGGSTGTSTISWASATVATSFTNPVVSDNRPVYISVVYLMRVD